MRTLSAMLLVGLFITACGGGTDSTSNESAAPPNQAAADVPDPCALAGDAVLDAYFGEAFEGEPTEAGPIVGCRWRDANANSLLIQVASDYALNRPDPCPDCVDLAFADDGYAAASPIQTIAAFIDGDTWYSVATTGFGDDADSISRLAQTILENATS